MWKILFKKQMLEMAAMFRRGKKKDGTPRNSGALAGTLVLYGVLFFFLVIAFSMLAFAFLPFLYLPGQEWLYYALVGMIAVLFGVFGTSFQTYVTLYRAKDNEFLLSMPVKPSTILSVRIVSVIVFGCLYGGSVLLPATVIRLIFAPITAQGAIFTVLLFPLLILFITVLSCLLGFVVALIAARLKNKGIIATLAGIGIFALYYYFYFKATDYLPVLGQYVDQIGNVIRSWVYPFYLLGRAAEGNLVAFLIISVTIIALFLLTYWILSKTFFSLTLNKKSGKKAVYVAREQQVSGIEATLLKREFRHLASLPGYMMNSALGTVLMPAVGVLALFKQEALRGAITAMGTGARLVSMLPAIVTGLMFVMICTNNLTASSVSLEGKSISILRSLPVPAEKVLNAKQQMALILTLPSVIAFSVLLSIAIGATVIQGVLIGICGVLYTCVVSASGLILNLKKPSFDWTSEMTVIKQSFPVTVVALGGTGVSFLLGGGMTVLCLLFPVEAILCAMAVILAGATWGMNAWLCTKGKNVWNDL